jgi:hypothetical protein
VQRLQQLSKSVQRSAAVQASQAELQAAQEQLSKSVQRLQQLSRSVQRLL